MSIAELKTIQVPVHAASTNPQRGYWDLPGIREAECRFEYFPVFHTIRLTFCP